MGRNKYIRCPTCSKNIRSDNMKLHSHSKVAINKNKMKQCPTCKKIMKVGNLARHLKTHDGKSKDVVKIAEKNQKNFDSDKEVGKCLRDKIFSGEIDFESLSKEHRRAFELSREFPKMGHLALRKWQEELIPHLIPDNRSIIWIVGTKGGEGKSWFQRYWLSVKGPKRVFQSNLEENGTAILHALSKQPTEIIEMFIFNVSRGIWKNDIPYRLLEQIKDGRTLSTKYNSKILNFKSPNIVLVFSNEGPCRTSLSPDRWKIFYIRNGKLKLDC